MDLVLLGGNVLTIDSMDTRSQAVAVKDGKIAAVGATPDVEKLVGENTTVVHMTGRTLIPGFIDPHNHFGMNTFDPVSVDCWTPPNEGIQNILDSIAQTAGDSLRGQWIWGSVYDQNSSKEKRLITRWELDEVAPDNPVCIMDASHHSLYANSAALKLAGIDRNTPDPPCGWVLKDDNGEPNGTLWERAMDPVHIKCIRAHMEHYGDSVADLVEQNCRRHLRYGITSVGDADTLPETQEMYRKADAAGKLPMTIHQLLGGYEFFAHPTDAAAGERGDGNVSDRLRGGTVKMFMDPVWPSAARVKCHPDGTKEYLGERYYDQEQSDAVVLEARKNGFQVGIHCLGNWSIEQALNSFEKAQKEYPSSDPRFRIEHFTFPTVELIQRAEALGVVASIQPPFVYSWAASQADPAEELGGGVMVEPYKTMKAHGLTVAAGSDYPCARLDPLIGLYAMVNRKGQRGEGPVAAEEAVTPLEGLRMYTMGSATAMRRETEVGSLEVGKRADMVLLSHDPTTGNPEFIRDINVEQTYVDGDLKYSRT
jgi:predicted amidohydrolase YtcJ